MNSDSLRKALTEPVSLALIVLILLVLVAIPVVYFIMQDRDEMTPDELLIELAEMSPVREGEEGEELLLNYLENNPDISDEDRAMILGRLGDVYHNREEYEKARETYIQARELAGPTSASVEHSLARMAEQEGDYETALEHYQTALPLYQKQMEEGPTENFVSIMPAIMSIESKIEELQEAQDSETGE